jgi:3-keto-5-aminohexanoate cleavage enzyme
MDKLIITAAIQGAELTKEKTPHLPISPEEVAQEAFQAWRAGAGIIHLHVRDDQGQPTQDPKYYELNMEAIERTGCQAVIQVSTGGAVGMSLETRMGPLRLKPEYSSLNTGTVNFGEDVFINSKQMMEGLAAVMQESGIKPEFEVYEEGHVHSALALVKKGLVTGRLNFNFVLGVPGAMSPSPGNLMHLCQAIPPEANWTVSGIGRHQLILGGMAVFMGGNVRVGFEDNIYYSRGVLAKTNAELVARMVRIAKEAGRQIASPEEARSILGLQPKG